MTRSRRPRPADRVTPSRAAPSPPAGLPLSHPAMAALLTVAAACLVVSVSYRLYDTDLWQHLAMGRAIWARGIPHVNLWTWPQYGEPYFLSSWLFRALIWPVWDSAGVTGLFAWRWLTTLGVFALILATARAMGARGFAAVLTLVWVSLAYRFRANVRPETLASLLFAAELLILERRRLADAAGAIPGRALWWIVAIAWVWANAHISYYLAFALLGMYALDALWAGRRSGAAGERARTRARQLVVAGLLALAAAFVNPFGWVALWQPFRFALFWRHDPLVGGIGELLPLARPEALTSGLLAWPALLLWRWRHRGLDLAETLACLAFSALALSSGRFLGTWALVAGPFMARDLNELLASRRWAVPSPPLAARAGLASAAAVLLCLPGWMRPELPIRIGFDPDAVPERACDFIETHGLRGRMLNQPHFGGYLAYRFPGERDRLPFISTQAEYAPAEERAAYLEALHGKAGWRAFYARHRFDLVVLEREQAIGDSLLDILDGDPGFMLVFADDAAELLVSRARFPALADSFAYQVIPAGQTRRTKLVAAAEQFPALRARASAELDRMIAASPRTGGASHLRGLFALMDGDLDLGRRQLERAIRLQPLVPGIHDALGRIALAEGRWRAALDEFEAERRRHEPPPGIDYRMGIAWRGLGRMDRARDAYRRELKRDPGHAGAHDSLAVMERHGG